MIVWRQVFEVELKVHSMLPHLSRDMVLEYVSALPDSYSRVSFADSAEFKVPGP